jgi:YbbR domain-containing protein
VLRHNLEYKAIAAAAALFIWFYVTFTIENPMVERALPGVQLEARNLPAGFSAQLSPQQVKVVVAGPKRLVGELEIGDADAWVDASRLKPGRSWAVVAASARAGLVSRVEPPRATIDLQPPASRARKVVPDLIGLPVGGVVGRVTAQPDEVQLTGPEIAVRQVARVVARVDLSEAAGGFRGLIRLRAVDADGRAVEEVRLNPSRVWVEVPLQAVTPARPMPIVLQTRGAVPRGFQIIRAELEPAVATVVGAAPATKDVATEPVDLSEVRDEVSTWVRLIVPPGATTVRPERVRVTLVVKKTRGGAGAR